MLQYPYPFDLYQNAHGQISQKNNPERSRYQFKKRPKKKIAIRL